jgi:hypothetical protein
MWLEVLDQLTKCNEYIGNRTRNLPACSIVPQPTKLPCAPLILFALLKSKILIEETHFPRMTAEFSHLFLQNVTLMKGCVNACDIRLKRNCSCMILVIVSVLICNYYVSDC